MPEALATNVTVMSVNGRLSTPRPSHLPYSSRNRGL